MYLIVGSVYLVGWGEDGYGTPFWIAINSWSASWGISGSFKIKRGVNMCGIETGYRPVAPVVVAPTTVSPTTTTTRAPTTTTTTAAPTTTRVPTTTTTTASPTTTLVPTLSPTTTTTTRALTTLASTTTTLAPTTAAPTTSAPNTEEPEPLVDITCPKGWSQFGTSCYFISGTLSTWSGAKSTCSSLGSSLAEIKNENESLFLLSVNRGNIQSAWLGLSAVNGVMVNDEGVTPSFTYWKSDAVTSSGCAVQIRDPVSSNVGKWKSEVCTAARIFVCKQEL